MGLMGPWAITKSMLKLHLHNPVEAFQPPVRACFAIGEYQALGVARRPDRGLCSSPPLHLLPVSIAQSPRWRLPQRRLRVGRLRPPTPL